MFALQASIGSLNDLRDAAADRDRKPGKPVPAGLVPPRVAAAVAGLGLVAGLALSAPSGPATVGVAAAGVALGYLYDLRLSRSPWSWLPLALALPLLPVHAWLGSTGTLPGGLLALVAVGAVAGAALGVANARADLERDRESGIATVAVRLGLEGSWRAGLALTVGALALAAALYPGGLGSAGASIALPVGRIAVPPALVVAAGAAAVLSGALAGRTSGPHGRERAWELQAIGTAVLGIGWIAAVVVLERPG